jgi:hypothetical protein
MDTWVTDVQGTLPAFFSGRIGHAVARGPALDYALLALEAIAKSLALTILHCMGASAGGPVRERNPGNASSMSGPTLCGGWPFERVTAGVMLHIGVRIFLSLRVEALNIHARDLVNRCVKRFRRPSYQPPH